ncbi:MAG: aspartate aminotransferase family protein [Desulfobacterota bacterium]|jgi:4-aminobutyrate aminotransferase|nr:aspartate aminotransferase family protein [Thermodesulfobacteriota bacterium]
MIAKEEPGQHGRLCEGDVNTSSRRSEWIAREISPESKAWLDRDSRAFLHQALSTPCLDVLTRCEGSVIEDLQGKRFLDFHGNSVHQVGFANPHVLSAIRRQLDTLCFSPRRFTNIPAVELAEKLGAFTPGDLSKVLFAPGGTTAVGMALKLARVATGRFKTLSMWDAFHGASLDVLSVGGESCFRKGIGPLLPGTEHVPPFEPYRCLWDSEGDCARCGLKCAHYIAYALEKEGDVSAVLAEPVRCTSVNQPPPGYWKLVREACDRHGALLVFDETAVCLGRTGRMFACEHDGVVPDILVLGKGLGGGVFPLAAIVARKDLDIARDKSLGHYTHEKNPVACAAGLAALEVIEREGLIEKTKLQGRAALERMKTMKEKHPLIGDVRGVGLLMGIELVKDRRTRAPAHEEAEEVMYRCLSRGLSFKVSQGNVLTLTPALTIADQELDQAFEILEQSLELTERNRRLL